MDENSKNDLFIVLPIWLFFVGLSVGLIYLIIKDLIQILN